MFTDSKSNYFSLQQVLDSLDFFISEYAEMHCVWFIKEGENLANNESKFIADSKNTNLHRCVHELYNYVFHQKYDLTDTNSSLEYQFYPFIKPPESLQHCATQVFRFWYQFITSGSYINPFFSEQEKPFAILAIEAYLRTRVDFALPGLFIRTKLTNEYDDEVEQFVSFMKSGSVPSLFTMSEMALLPGDSLSRLRGKIKEKGYFTPLLIDKDITEHHSNGRTHHTDANDIEILVSWDKSMTRTDDYQLIEALFDRLPAKDFTLKELEQRLAEIY